MNMQADIIRRLHIALPQVREWIDELFDSYGDSTSVASEIGFTRLSACFPQDLLERARVVTVEHVPFPPVEKYGLPEFATMQQMDLDGITFKDAIFLKRGLSSEALHFHELMHVIRWSRLGVDDFLLAYGLGLFSFGYAQNPLEQMAYALQYNFELGTLPKELISVIEHGTDAIWSHVAQIIRGQFGGA
jgi:hypothetical protein